MTASDGREDEELTPRERGIIRRAQLEARVANLEANSAAQKMGLDTLNTSVGELRAGLAILNMYLSGDPARRDDRGKIGELHDELRSTKSRMTAILAGVAANVGFFIVGLVTYFLEHH